MRNLTNEQRAEERSSTWLELFFDLCFVVAVAALAKGLHDDPTLGGALRFAAFFVPVWWAWMGFTWYATAFDNDDVLYRVTLLGPCSAGWRRPSTVYIRERPRASCSPTWR